MKKLIICIILTTIPLSSSKLFAQYKQEDPVTLELKGNSISAHQYGMLVSTPLSEVMGQDLYKSYKKAKSMNGWGIALTCIGSVVAVFGGVGAIGSSTFIKSEKQLYEEYRERYGDDGRNPYNPSSSNSLLIASYSVVGVAGVAMVACGIPMITIGKKRLKNIVAEFNLASTQNGVGLTMNF